MRKVIKILGKLLSATLLLLIIFPIALSLTLDIPAVQNFVAHKAAEFASEKLETKVGIDKLNITLPNKVNVYGFYVEDYQRDTLLYVDHLKANITGVNGGISFGSARAERAKLYLVESSDGVINIKEVVDRFSKKKKNENFRLTIDDAVVDSINLHIRLLEERNTEYGVDYSNMQLLDMKAHVENFEVAGYSISGDIRSLQFHERSGFVLDKLTGWFHVGKGLVELKNTNLLTAKSDIMLDSFSISSEDWLDYRDFIHNVRIDAEASDSRVSSYDVGFFAPQLREWHTTLSGVDVRMNGTVDDFTGRVRNARTNGGAVLNADVDIEGLPDYKESHFGINVRRFAAPAAEFERLMGNIAHLKIPSSVVEMIDRADDLTIKGRFDGEISDFHTKGVIGTASGDIGFDCKMAEVAEGGRSLDAKVASVSVDLGRILGNKILGNTSVKVAANGAFGADAYGIDVEAINWS